MLWIDRTTIGIHAALVACPLFRLLQARVASVTKRLERAVPELDRITLVRLDVIADRGFRDPSCLSAGAAERLLGEVCLGKAAPTLQPIPTEIFLGRGRANS